MRYKTKIDAYKAISEKLNDIMNILTYNDVEINDICKELQDVGMFEESAISYNVIGFLKNIYIDPGFDYTLERGELNKNMYEAVKYDIDSYITNGGFVDIVERDKIICGDGDDFYIPKD